MPRRILSVLTLVALAATFLPACGTAPNLTIEEHALAGPPTPDQVASILEQFASHAAQMQLAYAPLWSQGDGGAILTAYGNDQLTAVDAPVQGSTPPRSAIRVMKGATVMYETPPIYPSPLEPLQGLWAQGNTWTLEYAARPTDSSDSAGVLVQDGTVLHQSAGNGESFGYQLLAGNSFYFHVRDGKVRLIYSARELAPIYDSVPHYNCCEESTLNPSAGPNWVRFFGLRDGVWYFVQVGAY